MFPAPPQGWWRTKTWVHGQGQACTTLLSPSPHSRGDSLLRVTEPSPYPILGRCPLSSARPPGVPSKLCSGCCSRPPGADAGAPWRLLGALGQLSRTAPCPPACVLSAGTPAGGVLVPACVGRSPSSLQGCRLYWLVVLSDGRPFFSLLIPISGWTLAQSRNTVSVWRKNTWTLDPPWPAGSRIFGCVFTV